MRTTIYVDGFNLYYGCLRNTNYKWLDLSALFPRILKKKHKIEEINYFTAHVKPTDGDENIHFRQQAYLNALKSLSLMKFHYGNFENYNVKLRKKQPPHDRVEVIKTEEKGSDVNLATHILNDAWLNKYDCAVVVSNDSDLSEAMVLIKKHFPQKLLGLISPSTTVSKKLAKQSDFQRFIRKSDLEKSQFPDTIQGTNITKPKSW